ncbi:MAG TPA: hypothetical protein VLD57_07180 [Blastocatellia bacterium]|nr:hypothetical protein [Blastocatellia bacterium]
MSLTARSPTRSRGIIDNQELNQLRPNRKLAILVTCLMVFSLVAAHAGIERAKLGGTRSVTLPSYAILDEQAHPLIASNGKVGFISSVTSGSLIAFNLASGRVISSVVVGETAGLISMVEPGGRRLIAVPAANNPSGGHPATVSIIDATNTRRLDLHSLLVLPPAAQITHNTRAFLTGDGKYCLVATSLGEVSLLAFDVETGQLVTQIALAGRPSESALYESGARRTLAIASASANSLTFIDVGEKGELAIRASFTPDSARFDETNNPVFTSDGRTAYIAALEGDLLFQVDARSGTELARVEIDSPQRITIEKSAAGLDTLGVMRIRRPTSEKPGGRKPGGVSIVVNRGGRLSISSEFNPPEGIEFSRANNVVFDEKASIAFVGSATGMLFAFNVENGELETFQSIGSELRRVALNERGRSVIAIRSASAGDEVVIVGFELEASDDTQPAPRIKSLKPNVVEQGRVKNLRLIVNGENFSEGASLLINGTETAAEVVQQGRALEARLPRSLFDQPGTISVQVKVSAEVVSEPSPLSVVRPSAPVIDRIKPDEVPGPAAAFTVRVRGKNFRPSSTIFIDNQMLNTQRFGDSDLRAQVPDDVARSVRQIVVQIRDVAVPDLVSNEASLVIFGPRVREVRSSVNRIVAGTSRFGLRVIGENFRQGAEVEINGQPVPANRVIRQSGRLIRASVPGRLFQNAGPLSILVRNPEEGGVSEPKELRAFGPEITAFEPGKVLAGLSDARVAIRGENFLKHASVFVGDGTRAFKIEKQRIRFRSSTRIVVTLTDEVNELLKQAGELRFQIVNPNKADGVPSVEKTLPVAGPEIEEALIRPDREDGSRVRIIVTGDNFREGAVVEFVKNGAVVRRQDPERTSEGKLSLSMRARKLDALGVFEVRVVNPGEVLSNGKQPRVEALAE